MREDGEGGSVCMSSPFYFSVPREDELSSYALFQQLLHNHSVTHFSHLGATKYNQYYTVGSEWLHLEQLGIKHFPQEQLTGKIEEESSFSPLIPRFSSHLRD